jgi:glutamine cyclotransferase
MFLLIAAASLGIVMAAARLESSPAAATVRVVAEFPHDPSAFTQGLAIHGGALYEGTGMEGQSSLRRVELETGRIEARQDLDRAYFGEGIAIHGDRIYQLTWRNRLAVVYDLKTLQYLKTIRYSGEGWGLTSDGEHLILSDGSSVLKVVDPETFRLVRRISVKDGRRSLDKLNELEFVRGEIWANVWYSDRIARIDPDTGAVVAWVDLSEVYPRRLRRSKEYVLNGIAYDAEHDRIFVTGKNWPKLYEIELAK